MSRRAICFLGSRAVAGPVSPSEPTRPGNVGKGVLKAMDEDEKMDEDQEETDNEEIRDDEQEEEHQKTRAIASPILPSRRGVEDHNLTHIPFSSWCNHCWRRRGRRSAHKRRHDEGGGVDDRAVATYTSLKKARKKKETQRKARPEEARRWGDRSSWPWTTRLEEHTRSN